MNLLVDTQVLLWALNGEEKASPAIKQAIQSPTNRLYVSIACFWEIAIKIRLGKLTVPGNSVASVFEYARVLRTEVLPVAQAHLLELERLPMVHSDPFDRLIIAQARVEQLGVVSADGLFQQYGVTVVS